MPDSFAQLYVVFAEVTVGDTSKMLPCAYFLLPSKNSETYEIVLEAINAEVETVPDSIGIDFEHAMLRAIRSKLPASVKVNGCNFHWKQAIFKNVGSKGCLKLWAVL